MRCKAVLFLFFVSLFLLACREEQVRNERAFYFWKSTWALDSFEHKMLDSLHASKIYIKLFDVAWNTTKAQAIPVAKLNLKDSLSPRLTYVPVIYITNEAMLKTSQKEIPRLAEKMVYLIQLMMDSTKIHFNELQFDCDWSDLSRENYFLLLKEIKKHIKPAVQLSATIRLHQIKYHKRTGIPPVERGMIMFYNMGKVGDLRSTNSIFNKKDAERYIEHVKDYPLACDVALPIFRWGVLFQKEKISALLHLLTEKDLLEAGFKRQGNGYYSPPKAIYFRGYYLEPEDLIRIEEITPELALEAAQLLAKKVAHRDHNMTVSLYHLEPEYLKVYGKENLEKIYRSFE